MRTDPELSTGFPALHARALGIPTASNVVDLHAFFRVPGSPVAMFRWLRLHRPRGSTPAAAGHFAADARPVAWSVSFTFHVTGDPLMQRGLAFELTAASGGGTAVRVDAWAIWLVPRPAFERIPGGVHAVAVSLDGSEGKVLPVSTITDRASVATLIQSVNALAAVQPNSAVGCPSPAWRIDLRFAPAVGAAPVARVVEDGCAALSISVHGRSGPKLSIGFLDLDALLWRMHAVPVCTAGQLSGSATAPQRPSLLDPERTMRLHLTNASATVCGLKGLPRIQLRGADGQPLPTRPTTLDLVMRPVILAPNELATIELSWADSKQCHQGPAASIDVTPPGLASALTIAVGSLSHPVRPCDGLMSVGPVEQFVAVLDDQTGWREQGRLSTQRASGRV